jgi:hypothetical protein
VYNRPTISKYHSQLSELNIPTSSVPIFVAGDDLEHFLRASSRKYMFVSRHPNSGQNQNIRTANESFENVAKFNYLGTTLTNQKDIHDKIRNRLNSGNTCYYSAQNLLFSRLIQKT